MWPVRLFFQGKPFTLEGGNKFPNHLINIVASHQEMDVKIIRANTGNVTISRACVESFDGSMRLQNRHV